MWDHRNNPLRHGQSGVALVTVILMVAVLTAIVTRLSLVNSIWLRQVNNGSALVQARQATRAAQIWVSTILERDDFSFDGKTDDWAQPLIPIPVTWGEVFGWVDDMQSRFNVNNLVDEEGIVDTRSLAQFQYLLQELELDPGIAHAVVDWIDADSNTGGLRGAEDLYYLGLERPYLAANRKMLDVNELKQIRGIDEAAWNRMKDYVGVLPEGTPVNVNTASAVVIAAVMYNPDTAVVTLNTVEEWIRNVQTEPYTNINEFSEAAGGSIDADVFQGLAVSSSYFMAHTRTSFDKVEHRMATLYHREGGRARILAHTRELF